MANEFDQLQPASWRGIQFPVENVEVSFQQDIAEHKYYGIDGARLEATGRAPVNITVTIPLFNGIVPGKNEKWGVLYPDLFRQLLNAAGDRSAGVLVHPELGQITCRVKSAQTRHDAQHRDGVILTLHFVETGLLAETNDFVTGSSPIAAAELAALDLDASKDDLTKLVPDAYQMPFTVNDFIDSLAAVGDQFSVQSSLAKGKIDAIGYHLGRLQASVERAENALTWPVLDAIQAAKSAVRWVAEHPPATLPVLLWPVRADITLAALLGEIPGAELSDLVKLNPSVMATPVILAGTVVRYHDRSR
jgi:hypothetical protein